LKHPISLKIERDIHNFLASSSDSLKSLEGRKRRMKVDMNSSIVVLKIRWKELYDNEQVGPYFDSLVCKIQGNMKECDVIKDEPQGKHGYHLHFPIILKLLEFECMRYALSRIIPSIYQRDVITHTPNQRM
jgi:hypothetical protein